MGRIGPRRWIAATVICIFLIISDFNADMGEKPFSHFFLASENPGVIKLISEGFQISPRHASLLRSNVFR